MSKKVNETETKLAKKYRCDARTIRRWKASGAPLNDPKQMRAWLSGQRSLPRGTMEVLAEARRTERAKSPASTVPKSAHGAGAALTRLEAQEVSAHAAVVAAEARGDTFELRAAETRWLRITTGLLRYDLAVDQIRRDAGELLPRSEIIGHLKRLGGAMRHGLYRTMQEIAPTLSGLKDENEIWKIIGRTLDRLQLSTLAGTDLPEWMSRTLNAELSCQVVNLDESLDSSRKAFLAWVRFLAGNDAIRIRTLMDDRKKAYAKFTNEPNEAERKRIWDEEVRPLGI